MSGWGLGVFGSISLRDYQEHRWLAHDREHAALSASIDRAREVVDTRLEGMNELRGQIDRERGNYLTRESYDSRHEVLVVQLNLLSTQVSTLRGQLVFLAASVPVLVAIAAIGIGFVH